MTIMFLNIQDFIVVSVISSTSLIGKSHSSRYRPYECIIHLKIGQETVLVWSGFMVCQPVVWLHTVK